MNQLKSVALLVTVSLLGACAAQPEHLCPGANPGIVPININYNGANINVAPDPQTAHIGDVLQFNLIGPNDILVSTSGKTAADGWLNGSGKKKAGNSASEKFYVCVRDDLPIAVGAHKDYKYNVDAVGKPQLDPVVRVHNP